MQTVGTLEAEWRQVFWGSVSTGAKEGKSIQLTRLGCLISPCYNPFSLGVHFETYKLFSSSVFTFFSCRGKLQKTETMDTEQRMRGIPVCG
jgi:hypothetical protein